MGRVRQFDERESVDTATRVFWESGYEATSLPMLLDAMSLSKSSFYLAFRSKEELFLRCLEHYADGLVQSMKAALAEAPSGLSFIRTVLESVADEGHSTKKRWGCLVMNTATEFGQRQPGVAKLVSRQTTRFEDVFEQALKREESESGWSSTQPRRTVARFLVCTLSGLKTMSKTGASRSALRDTARVALLALS